ncbi:MAG: hypothetical protein M1820_008062 [Bogoriella megaspora]|nr:MAG: hypothetical protein M1820_008062 [Bogoriella megaspora]
MPSNDSGLSALKRKQPPTAAPPLTLSSKRRKYAKARDARSIATQTSSKAFSNGELDVDKFVKAREHEIKALEDALIASKKVLRKRAFQGVPKDLRRRTASHNVKRVPRRLRERASREASANSLYRMGALVTQALEVDMAEDNTPVHKRKITGRMRLRLETAQKLREMRQNATKRNEPKAKDAKGKASSTKGEDEPGKGRGPLSRALGQTREPRVKKNILQEPPKPKALFRRRQIYKTWLPTHLYHAKRAHMTPPKEPLWRFALPLTPTDKSYRATHRASGQRGAVAWDTSYMSTISLEGQEKSIQGLLKDLGIGPQSGDEGLWLRKGERWRRGTRTWNGWLFKRQSWPKRPIGPAVVIWHLEDNVCEDSSMVGTDIIGKKKPRNRKALIRIHPSAFLSLWEEVLRLAKIQKPMVMVEDLRFEIGSIDVTGPASTEALLATLSPNPLPDDSGLNDDSPSKIWTAVGSVSSPSQFPPGALLAFEVGDPRLHFPIHKQDSAHEEKPNNFQALSLLSAWPVDRTQTPASIFDRTFRLKAQRDMPSQKAINRRRTLAGPGCYPEPKTADPRIPVLLLANRTPTRSQGTWTLILPWKCVKLVWYCLLHVPLSTGGTVRFGGLKEMQQVAFEDRDPWFPGDFPGTEAGMDWEMRERKRRKDGWERKPKGKRIEWGSVDLGNGRKGEVGMGWACDWERLLSGPQAEKSLPADGPKQGDRETQEGENATTREEQQEIYESSDVAEANKTLLDHQLEMYHLISSEVTKILESPSPRPLFSPGALINVRISFLARGSATPCSRVYRLPTNNQSLRKQWLSLIPDAKATANSKKKPEYPPPLPKDAPQSYVQQRLAKILFEPTPLNPHSSTYPVVPDEVDLIGFITTGNYNLGEGKGTGLGSVLLERVLKSDESRRWNVTKGTHDFHEDKLCIVRESGLGFGRLATWDFCK